ncbi:MAG: hypothetical protein AAB074_20075 [Planctomycetota bacterium]
MRVAFAHFADFVNITHDGKLNVLGIFEAVRATHVPASIPSLALVFRVEAEAHELGRDLTILVDVQTPKGVSIPVINAPFRVERLVPDDPGPTFSTNVTVTLQNLVLESFGRYEFRLLHFQVVLHSLALTVLPIPLAKSKAK